jgi:PI-3-kinase-related kinase SMG-1
MGVTGRYTYLFKGLEDLHLDERLMQLLDVVNVMFKGKPLASGETVFPGITLQFLHALTVALQLRARNYNVTPLGSRSGLIQWVDRSVPVFALFKQWQHREYESAKARYQKEQQSKKTGRSLKAPQPPIRPTNLFFNKVTPALKQQGISKLMSRSKWPRNVLKKVHKKLVAETPSDLISRELWAGSHSSAEWFSKTEVCSRRVGSSSEFLTLLA